MRRERGFLEDFIDHLREIGSELRRRYVHRYSDRIWPLRRIDTRATKHPFPEAMNDTGFLCKGDEVRRRDEPPLGMVPAHQRLESDDFIGVDVDLRLVE